MSISFEEEFFQETIRSNITSRSRLFHETGEYIDRLRRAGSRCSRDICIFLLGELATFADDDDQRSQNSVYLRDSLI
jgi:hypothetical protein